MNWIFFFSIWALVGIGCYLISRKHIKVFYAESKTNGFFTENQYLLIALIGSVVFAPIVAIICIWDLIDDMKTKKEDRS